MFHSSALSPALPPALSGGEIVPRGQVQSDASLIETWVASFGSWNTRVAYKRDVRTFQEYFPGPLASVTVRDLQQFAETLTDLAPTTQARRLSAVKSLLTMARRMGWIPFNPGELLKLPGIKDDLAERILTEAQVQRLFYVERDPRDGAFLRLLYGAGLRVSEACGLRWKDMVTRDDAGQLTVMGKGNKTRIILLPTALWRRVEALRGAAGPNDPVFRSRKGGPIRRLQAHRIMKLAVERAGLPSNTSCHYLRHAHASHALDRSCPVHVLQQTLGHASLTTTTRYSHARPGDSSAKYLAA